MKPAFGRFLRVVFIASVALWSAQAFAAGKVADTKHNLSASGLGLIKSAEPEICVFCHVPHNASNLAPLWNRRNPATTTTYTPYSSSTFPSGTMNQPNGSSLLCLSCHDGTIALGELLSRGATNVSMTGPITSVSVGKLIGGSGYIGTNLSDDHPVSFAYAARATISDGELASSPTDGKVKLDASGQMQCSSCHDAHDNTNGKFLVMPNTASGLCIACHTKAGWSTSSHATSAATWSGTGTNPWLHTSGLTVAANACENCHQPHTAGGGSRLLNYAADEANCYTCHTGTVAGKTAPAKNMQSEMLKISGHNVASYTGLHDPTEANVVNSRHVECADCHNPHQTNASVGATLVASGFPVLPGALRGVKGVNISGVAVASVTYEYEVCFRCHGDSSGKKASTITRLVPSGAVGENNVRKEFVTTNASFHPVAGVGKSTTVPSLISPLTVNSTMTCSSCHSNNAGPGAAPTIGTGPKGPHGSTISPLLDSAYVTADNTSESAANYALCYKCHSRTSILADASFPEHNKHISKQMACSACHDPHGVSTNAHLINFDTKIVTASGGVISYSSTGPNKGSCTLTCHGKNHSPETY